MIIKPYLIKFSDTWILGPTASRDTREFRFGLSLIVFEVGIVVMLEKPFGYGCSDCGAIGYAQVDRLPEGWVKKYRKDSTYHFLCPKCQRPPARRREDIMLVKDLKRQLAEIPDEAEVSYTVYGKKGDEKGSLILRLEQEVRVINNIEEYKF